jgi:glucose-1-phosphate adenylyltransferase
MDYGRFIDFHREKQADISISVYPVFYDQAHEFGVMKVDKNGQIVTFLEKPQGTSELDEMKIPEEALKLFPIDGIGRTHLASMGIYLFNWDVLNELLENTDCQDFGREMIPYAIQQKNVRGYFFDGYWQDIGTIRSFFEIHMDLTEPLPKFNFYDEHLPIFSRPRFLPGSKLLSAEVHNSILCEGSIINRSQINHSIIGIRSRIGQNSVLDRTVMMGADFFETKDQIKKNQELGVPDLGIGGDCEIRNAILDKNVRIGNHVKITNNRNVSEETSENYVIRDGIVVVAKNAVIPDGTVI